MNASELSRVIEAVGKDRGIKREIIISALEQAVLTAAQKKYGSTAVLEAHYNNETGEIGLKPFPVLPSHYKCNQSGAILPVENPEVWVYPAEDLRP